MKFDIYYYGKNKWSPSSLLTLGNDQNAIFFPKALYKNMDFRAQKSVKIWTYIMYMQVYFYFISQTSESTGNLFSLAALRLPDSYDGKITKICNLWTFCIIAIRYP